MGSVNNMIEAAAALIIALVTFAIGFGSLRQKVDSNKAISDERWKSVQGELKVIKEDASNTRESLGDIKRDIAEIRIHVNYIVEAIRDKK